MRVALSRWARRWTAMVALATSLTACGARGTAAPPAAPATASSPALAAPAGELATAPEITAPGEPDGAPAAPSSGAEPPGKEQTATEPPQEAPFHRADAMTKLAVPGLGAVLVSEGAPEAHGVLVYLHGLCGDPEAFQAFVSAVPASLTLLSVRGDVKCRTNTRSRWSNDARAIDARIRRAVVAVSAQRATPLDDRGWWVFGYSQGALRAEALLARFPDRYVGGVLAGGPRAPKPSSLEHVRRVVLMAGSRDVRGHLIHSAEALASEGVAAQFALLPEARHGEYGPEAERVVGEALRWLTEPGAFTAAGRGLQE